jgi:hypothetical protein
MKEQQKAEAYVREKLPELMELSFGCDVEWQGTNYRNGNKYPVRKGKIVTWLSRYGRKMYILRFIGDRDVTDPFREEELKIIGHPIQLQHWLRVLATVGTNIGGYVEDGIWHINLDGTLGLMNFNLTTGQPATDLDFKAFNDIISS